jgi:hypothetical protein
LSGEFKEAGKIDLGCRWNWRGLWGKPAVDSSNYVNPKKTRIMKKLKDLYLFGGLLIMTFVANGQEVKYEDVEKGIITKGQYESYVSKDGSVYKVGDKIQFGNPSGTNGKFVTIQKVDITGTFYIVGAEAINSSAEIKKIRIGGTSRAGYKVSFQTKGMTGIDNYFLYIEDAITVGEVQSFGMTSDEALIALKKAKDKLDLGIITQEEYDKIKAELTPFIK